MKTERLQHLKSKKVTNTAAESMTALINATNVMGYDKEISQGMLTAMLKAHPTLLQSFLRGLVSASSQLVETCPNKLQDGRLVGGAKVIEQLANFDEGLPFIWEIQLGDQLWKPKTNFNYVCFAGSLLSTKVDLLIDFQHPVLKEVSDMFGIYVYNFDYTFWFKTETEAEEYQENSPYSCKLVFADEE